MKSSNSSIKSSILAIILSSLFINNAEGMNVTIEHPTPQRSSTARSVVLSYDYEPRSASERQSYDIFETPERSPPVDPVKKECGCITHFLNTIHKKLFDIALYEELESGFLINITASKRAAHMIDDQQIVFYLNDHLLKTLFPNNYVDSSNLKLNFDTLYTSLYLNRPTDIQHIKDAIGYDFTECTSNIRDFFSCCLEKIKQSNSEKVFVAIQQKIDKIKTNIFITNISDCDCSEFIKRKYEYMMPEMQNTSILDCNIYQDRCFCAINKAFLSMFAKEEHQTLYNLLYNDIINILSNEFYTLNTILRKDSVSMYFKNTFDLSRYTTSIVCKSRHNRACLASNVCAAIYRLYDEDVIDDGQIELLFMKNIDKNGFIISLKNI